MVFKIAYVIILLFVLEYDLFGNVEIINPSNWNRELLISEWYNFAMWKKMIKAPFCSLVQ